MSEVKVTADWLARLMINVNRVHGDGLQPIKSLSEVSARYADAWVNDARDVLSGISPLAPAIREGEAT